MDYAIVSRPDIELYASPLATLLANHYNTVFWLVEDFERQVSRMRPETRVIFVGENQFTSFLRHFFEPRWQLHDIYWGYKDKKAAIWAWQNTQDKRAAISRIEKELNKHADPVLAKSQASFTDHLPSGRVLAARYIHRSAVHPSASVSPRIRLLGQQYRLGIATFLADGFHNFSQIQRGGKIWY